MGTDESPPATRSCAACGLQNPLSNRFCGNCGGPLAAAAAGPSTGAPAAPRPVVAPEAAAPDSASTPTLKLPVDPLPPVRPAVAQPAPYARVAPVAPPNAPAEPALTGMARERERDRLLTLANVQRSRDQGTEARKTLQQALKLMEGMPGPQVAPIHEMIGDFYDAEAHWDDARKAYNTAHELDPSRVSAERKFAALTLRVAETSSTSSLAQAVLRGDSIADLLATGALASERGRRNAGLAMFLSTVMPGFGQFYNGEIAKGSIVLAAFAGTLLYFAVSPDREVFLHKFAAILALSRSHAANAAVSPISVFVGILLVGVWLFAIVDAPFTASKSANMAGGGGSAIDKSGWEV